MSSRAGHRVLCVRLWQVLIIMQKKVTALDTGTSIARAVDIHTGNPFNVKNIAMHVNFEVIILNSYVSSSFNSVDFERTVQWINGSKIQDDESTF